VSGSFSGTMKSASQTGWGLAAHVLIQRGESARAGAARRRRRRTPREMGRGRIVGESSAAQVTSPRSDLDVTHAEIGAYVLGTWGLGCTVVEALANHHAPRRIAQDGLGVAASVYLPMALIESDALDYELVGRLGSPADLARWRDMATEI